MKIKKIGISIIMVLALLFTAMPGFTSRAEEEKLSIKINPVGEIEVGKEATLQVDIENISEETYEANVVQILVSDDSKTVAIENGWNIIENDAVSKNYGEHDGGDPKAVLKKDMAPEDKITFEVTGTIEKEFDDTNPFHVNVRVKSDASTWTSIGYASYESNAGDTAFEGTFTPSELTVKRGEEVEIGVAVTNTTEEEVDALSFECSWTASMMKGAWVDDVKPALTWKRELTPEGKLVLAADETVEGTLTVKIPENATPSWFEFGVDVYSGTEEAGDLKTYFSGSVRLNMEGGVLNPYPDVKVDNGDEQGDWYAEFALFMLEQGIMTGEDNGMFNAGREMHRDEFVTMLYRFDGEKEVAYDPEVFPDVEDGLFYTKAAMWAKESGVVEGYADGNFGVGDAITREDMAKMLLGYAKHIDFELAEEGDLSKFPDADSVSGYAVESMKWAVGNGFITGDEGNINPQKYAERGHCAKIMTVFVQKYMGL